MHVARLLCQVFIHWELLPFLPVRYARPEGPILVASGCFEAGVAPSGFWESSARECFSAANAIIELISDLRANATFVTNAFTVYAVFVARFMETYARSFPWMDPNQRMSTLRDHIKPEGNCDRARASDNFLVDTQGGEDIVLPALQWYTTLSSIADYFGIFKKDFYANNLTSLRLSSPYCNGGYDSSRCLREGGAGDGREEYEVFRPWLREFGKL